MTQRNMVNSTVLWVNIQESPAWWVESNAVQNRIPDSDDDCIECVWTFRKEAIISSRALVNEQQKIVSKLQQLDCIKSENKMQSKQTKLSPKTQKTKTPSQKKKS